MKQKIYEICFTLKKVLNDKNNMIKFNLCDFHWTYLILS